MSIRDVLSLTALAESELHRKASELRGYTPYQQAANASTTLSHYSNLPNLPCLFHVASVQAMSSSCSPPSMIISDSTPTSLIPDITTPSHHALNGSSGPVECRSHIQVEDRLSSGFGRSRVIVDYISHLSGLATRRLPLHKPVMSVKGRLGPLTVSNRSRTTYVVHVPKFLRVDPAHELQHARLRRS